MYHSQQSNITNSELQEILLAPISQLKNHALGEGRMNLPRADAGVPTSGINRRNPPQKQQKIDIRASKPNIAHNNQIVNYNNNKTGDDLQQLIDGIPYPNEDLSLTSFSNSTHSNKQLSPSQNIMDGNSQGKQRPNPQNNANMYSNFRSHQQQQIRYGLENNFSTANRAKDDEILNSSTNGAKQKEFEKENEKSHNLSHLSNRQLSDRESNINRSNSLSHRPPLRQNDPGTSSMNFIHPNQSYSQANFTSTPLTNKNPSIYGTNSDPQQFNGFNSASDSENNAKSSNQYKRSLNNQDLRVNGDQVGAKNSNYDHFFDQLHNSEGSGVDSSLTPNRLDQITDWSQSHVTPGDQRNIFPNVLAPSIELSNQTSMMGKGPNQSSLGNNQESSDQLRMAASTNGQRMKTGGNNLGREDALESNNKNLSNYHSNNYNHIISGTQRNGNSNSNNKFSVGASTYGTDIENSGLYNNNGPQMNFATFGSFEHRPCDDSQMEEQINFLFHDSHAKPPLSNQRKSYGEVYTTSPLLDQYREASITERSSRPQNTGNQSLRSSSALSSNINNQNYNNSQFNISSGNLQNSNFINNSIASNQLSSVHLRLQFELENALLKIREIEDQKQHILNQKSDVEQHLLLLQEKHRDPSQLETLRGRQLENEKNKNYMLQESLDKEKRKNYFLSNEVKRLQEFQKGAKDEIERLSYFHQMNQNTIQDLKNTLENQQKCFDQEFKEVVQDNEVLHRHVQDLEQKLKLFESKQSLEDVQHTYQMRIQLLTDELNKMKSEYQREVAFLQEQASGNDKNQTNIIGNNTISVSNTTQDTVGTDENMSFNQKCSCKLEIANIVNQELNLMSTMSPVEAQIEHIGEEIISKFRELRINNEMIERDLKQSRQQLMIANDDNKRLKTENEISQDNINMLTKFENERKSEMERLISEKNNFLENKVKSDKNEFEKRTKELKSENDEIQMKLEQTEREKERLELKLRESKQIQDELREKIREINERRREETEREQEKAREREIERQREKFSTSSPTFNEKFIYQKQSQELSLHLEELQKLLREKEREIGRYHIRIEELNMNVYNLEQERDFLKRASEISANEVKTSEKQKSLEEKLDQLNVSMREKDKKNVELYQENKKLLQESNSTKEEKKKLEIEFQGVRQTLSLKNSEVQNQILMVKSLNEQITDFQARINELQSQNESLEKDLFQYKLNSPIKSSLNNQILKSTSCSLATKSTLNTQNSRDNFHKVFQNRHQSSFQQPVSLSSAGRGDESKNIGFGNIGDASTPIMNQQLYGSSIDSSLEKLTFSIDQSEAIFSPMKKNIIVNEIYTQFQVICEEFLQHNEEFQKIKSGFLNQIFIMNEKMNSLEQRNQQLEHQCSFLSGERVVLATQCQSLQQQNDELIQMANANQQNIQLNSHRNQLINWEYPLQQQQLGNRKGLNKSTVLSSFTNEKPNPNINVIGNGSNQASMISVNSYNSSSGPIINQNSNMMQNSVCQTDEPTNCNSTNVNNGNAQQQQEQNIMNLLTPQMLSTEETIQFLLEILRRIVNSQEMKRMILKSEEFIQLTKLINKSAITTVGSIISNYSSVVDRRDQQSFQKRYRQPQQNISELELIKAFEQSDNSKIEGNKTQNEQQDGVKRKLFSNQRAFDNVNLNFNNPRVSKNNSRTEIHFFQP